MYRNGIVKNFNREYGFIGDRGLASDVFVFYFDVITDGYRSLKRGQHVQYELESTPKGYRAKNVRVV